MNYTLDCQSFLKKFKRCKCRLKTFIYTFLFHKFLQNMHLLINRRKQKAFSILSTLMPQTDCYKEKHKSLPA